MAVIKKTVAPSTPDVIKEYPQGDGEVKTGGMIQGDAPQQIWGAASMNPSMQSDSAQKTIDNVPEATAQGGASTPTEQDWRAGLKNPNQHLENYGDDSSLPYQEHPETLGGTMAKYEGEGVMTTSGAEIDKNKQLDQLDPSYRYGKQSQIYGSTHDGYIQERNDNIATALWNAGIRDPEGIRAWLEKQPGFMESSEHDRNNTVMSIYKRMGTEPAKQQDAGNSANKDEGVNLQDVGEGRIYGKDTPYEGDLERGMRTEVDPMNITNLMNVARENNVKALAGMNVNDIAAAISEGYIPMGDQAYRDLQQFYPSIYAQVQDALKAYKGQATINNITSGGTVDAVSETNKQDDTLNNSIDSWVEKNSDERTAGQVKIELTNDLSQNQTVSSATAHLKEYKTKIAELQQKIEQLPKDARKLFKGDVPQYLVNAVVANRSQQYQSEISKYQSLYAATLEEAKMEISNAQWQKEYDLKKQQLEIDSNYKNAQLALAQGELVYNMQKTSVSNGKRNEDGTYSYVDINGQMHTLTQKEANNLLIDTETNGREYTDYWRQKLRESKANGEEYFVVGQCEQFTDNYARQYYGVSMKGENGEVTTWEEKAKYATEALPKVGYVAVWHYMNSGENAKKYGHTGIVVDYDAKSGTFTVLEANHKGKQELGEYTYSINSPNLIGFWNPAAEALRQQEDNANGGIYYYYNTPMYKIFQEAYANAGTKDERINIDQAREAYSILNELNEGGFIDNLINNEVFSSLMTDLATNSATQLKNRNFVDNDGNIVWDVVKQTIVNETLDPNMGYAIDRLHRLVEIKLRKESGAAINISEWLGNFDMYMPQVGMDKDYKMNRLQALEHDMVSGLLPTSLVGKYRPIIATEAIKTSRKVREEELEELAEASVNYYAEEEEESEVNK